MTNPAYEATNSDVEKPFSEEHERPSKILFIIAARIARREHLRPLYALSELNQKTIGTRALNQIIEQVEESLLRESGKLVRVAEKYEELKRQNAELARRIAELESAPNGMMQISNELEEMKRKCVELQEQKDKWAAWAIALGAKADELESRPLCVKSNDAMREVAPLCVKLPDSSSKAFWSGIGKTEQFHPETYKRWVKEAIERAGSIAGIKVEVK